MSDIEGFIKKYVSSRRKTSLRSVLARKPFPLPEMQYLLKNTFSLYGKNACSGKKSENGFH